MFHWFSCNSDLEATWISLIGWPHKTSNGLWNEPHDKRVLETVGWFVWSATGSWYVAIKYLPSFFLVSSFIGSDLISLLCFEVWKTVQQFEFAKFPLYFIFEFSLIKNSRIYDLERCFVENLAFKVTGKGPVRLGYSIS